MLAGQSQKEFYVNEAHARIDALLHAAIEGIANTPPTAPVEGECWLVDTAPTGGWATNPGEVACFEADNWVFVAPRDGLQLLNRSTGQILLYRGDWTAPTAPAIPAGGSTIDSQARTAIAELIAALSAAGILPG